MVFLNHKQFILKHTQIIYRSRKNQRALGITYRASVDQTTQKTSASDMKNLSCTSALIEGSPVDRKAINDQFSFHNQGSSHFDKVTTNHPWRPNKESSQAIADFSSKLDQSKISSIRDFFGGVSSLKVSFRFFISW